VEITVSVLEYFGLSPVYEVKGPRGVADVEWLVVLVQDQYVRRHELVSNVPQAYQGAESPGNDDATFP
jgi:hypothetical protein